MARLRVSAISFLNTAPLMWDFDHAEARRHFDVHYTLPSACAEELRAGTSDIGIIPVAAYATIPDLVVIAGVAIAARGPVRSILLLSKLPLEQIKTVALDTSSRTSVALTRVLLERFHKLTPEYVAMEPKLKPMLARADAALLIGDPALLASESDEVRGGKLHAYDLAEMWQELTGKAFVFAFWAVRRAALANSDLPPEEVARTFQLSRDHGLEPESIARIAREWKSRLGLPEPLITDYLTRNIYYKLDTPCLDGLQHFFRLAAEVGALPGARRLDLGLHTISAGSTISTASE
jgi:chorismate dehydratase